MTISPCMSGIFITFEGIEGCGKSTQIEKFADFLGAEGKALLLTREPGGTDIGDQIREILLNPANTAMSPTTELLLYAAARAQHVEEKIRPALKNGQIVLSDRYADATSAYQGAARNLSSATLKELHQIATGDLIPDITFLFDLPAEKGLGRARDRNTKENVEDRFENEEINFHEKVRAGYLALAKDQPDRFIVIDASGGIEETFNQLITKYKERIK
jgi:dTMP kinase